MTMKKSIIFCVIILLTAAMAVIEEATVGFPEINYLTLSICGVCLGLGLIYMKLSLYKLKDILWCLFGGLALTMFVTIGEHMAYCLPIVVDYFNLDGLATLLSCMITAMFVTAVYSFSIYIFVFHFCDICSKIKNFE